MVAIHHYLNFEGTTEEAFEFYRSIFGGEFTMIQRFKDTPDGANLSPEEQEKIMHIALPVGEHGMLMATDALESMGRPFTAGNNFSISLMADSKEEADKLFNGLSAGGTVDMPLNDTFWGAYFGMFHDKFGVHWMVNYDYPKA